MWDCAKASSECCYDTNALQYLSVPLFTAGGMASEGAKIPMSPEVRESRLTSGTESLNMSARPILVLLE